MSSFQKCFSAPGKALLAGGYLVLDPANGSFVTALSARIYAFTTPVPANEGLITVSSPQFKEGEWAYRVKIATGTGYVTVLPVDSSKSNPFVFSAVHAVLNYLSASNFLTSPIPALKITILSDNAYHSQPSGTVTKFNKHSAAINQVPKTGMGSSAALTTSLTAGLLSFYAGHVVNNKRTLHNLAQLSHCSAQGKIGSGFDVACAVYGSIQYNRFQPSIISSVSGIPELGKEKNYVESIRTVIDSDWGVVTEPCTIPRRVQLLMGDVSGGSETPKLVQLVQKWRNEIIAKTGSDPQAWTSLGKANIRLIQLMNKLSTKASQDSAEYDKTVDKILALKANSQAIRLLVDGNETENLFANVVQAIVQIRKYLQQITDESGAQIEPKEQTALLDACSDLTGVIGGVVPGAGGYDAICLVVVEEAVDDIKFSKDGVLSKVHWLDLREEDVGLREENVEELVKFL
ncbi:ribosomal protein S5 domain 2-type protein [Lipomyces japonicus]|uniref:ribosomal protein S5 domain 2-type protein n=1 Tax=Lipomyces japonicus TaxID=56871 RepID=UPI0034CF6F9A